MPGEQKNVDTKLPNGANYGFPVNTMHIVANKAGMHRGVFSIDICQRQFHFSEQSGRRRVFLSPGFVMKPGRDVTWLQVPFSSMPGEQKNVDTKLPNGANYGRHLQPGDIAARLHHIADPVRRPGVIEDRFSLLKEKCRYQTA
jgi:hypothetical protein